MDVKTTLEWREQQGSRTWEYAKELVDEANSTREGGHNDWRLPTRAELLQLYGTDQAPDGGFFWTSDVCDDTPGCAWVVDFLVGRAYKNFYRTWAYVRLVRSVVTTKPDPTP